jgi:hypothetical protein
MLAVLEHLQHQVPWLAFISRGKSPKGLIYFDKVPNCVSIHVDEVLPNRKQVQKPFWEVDLKSSLNYRWLFWLCVQHKPHESVVVHGH